MATFRKRPGPKGNIVWQAQIIRLGFKPQYRTFDARGQAEAWARKIETEMDAGAWQDRSEGDRTTVAQALGRYLAEITPGKSSTTVANERARILRLQNYPLGRVSLSRLAGRDVAEFIQARLKDGVQGASVGSELAILSHLYTVARTAWGMSYLVNPVPLAKAARPKLPPGRDRRLQGDEERRLLDAASPDFAAVIRFVLATCLRRGEVAALRWEQVDLKRRCLTLSATDTKTRTARTVPLSPAALEVLRSVPRQLGGSVFGMSANAISMCWKRVIDKTGIKNLTFHDLRHEAISRLFENTDLDVMEIRAISGHKTLQMLARYTHLRTHRLADRLAGKTRGA